MPGTNLINLPEYASLSSDPVAIALLVHIRLNISTMESGFIPEISPVSLAQVAEEWGLSLERVRAAAYLIMTAERRSQQGMSPMHVKLGFNPSEWLA